MTEPGKILLIQTSFIGDVILSTAALEQLHDHWPAAKITVLVRKGVESLFSGHPFIHEVNTWDKSNPKVPSLRKLIKGIRQERYDAVITLHRFASSGFLCAFSKAPIRAGFDKNPLSRLFTHRVAHLFDGRHEVDRNQALIARVTGELPSTQAKPRLYPTSSDRDAIQSLQSEPYICIAPTSVWATKAWPPSKWIALINELPTNHHVHLLGAAGDRAQCDAIIKEVTHPAAHNLCGELSLLQSAALMKGAVMNYCNDSAPMHLASAVDAPITAVYCSTVPAFGFGPLSTQSRIVETKANLKCRPCGLHGHQECPEGHFKCAQTIEVDQLI